MKKIIIIITLVLTSVMLFSQGVGGVSGIVKDKNTGEPLPGVEVIIKETSQGTATTNNGTYKLTNVAVGYYTLEAQIVGYEKISLKIYVNPHCALFSGFQKTSVNNPGFY